MIRRDPGRLLAVLGALLLLSALPSCAGNPEPAGSTANQDQMLGHYGRFAEIQAAIVRGDLAGAQGAARSLQERPLPSGLPATAKRWMSNLRTAAGKVASARHISDAAAGEGEVARACGWCHQGLDVEPAVRINPGVPSGSTAADHMRREKWALDQMMDGLVSGDSELWVEGGRMLAGVSPGDLAGAAGSADVAAMARRLGGLGRDALAAADEQRPVVYGRILETCAECHRVVGVNP